MVDSTHSGPTPANKLALHAAPVVAMPDDQECALFDDLLVVRDKMLAASRKDQHRLARLAPIHAASARNLLHYLALRRLDVRPMQERLLSIGLSSLGRSEGCALDSVERVLSVLHRLTGRQWEPAPETDRITLSEGRRLLALKSEMLFGKSHKGRSTRIMVTMPREAADDPAIIRDLLASGMDCMRINCAHDDQAAWTRMIRNLRTAEAALGRTCLIVMDLAGPKLRTGSIEPGPAVAKWRPRRDQYGRTISSARVRLVADEPCSTPAADSVCLPVPRAWLDTLQIGDEISLTDARGRKRRLAVISVQDGSAVAEGDQTGYITPGTRLTRTTFEGSPTAAGADATVGEVPALEGAILIQAGDSLLLTSSLAPGRPATFARDGTVSSPARIGCSLPEVFAGARPGQHVWLDDGKFGGVIRTVDPDQILVDIDHAPPGGGLLRAEKSINLPDTDLRLSAVTAQDREDTMFAARHADMIALSFVQSPDDIVAFYDLLEQIAPDAGDRKPALVLKIETRRAFERLPELVLSAMQGTTVGIMIARGDLAVECGFERLAEVQEEILWLAEAAHIPVIWATQVLETAARTGRPTRAEISDAAMGQRTECVMLNKGPYIVQAVRTLDDILRRMTSHQHKKRHLLRRLRAWDPDYA